MGSCIKNRDKISYLNDKMYMEKVQVVSICGSQWGDEGKGKYSGFFSKDFDYIARFNGCTFII